MFCWQRVKSIYVWLNCEEAEAEVPYSETSLGSIGLKIIVDNLDPASASGFNQLFLRLGTYANSLAKHRYAVFIN
jgi:hypothetical protein